ncbi:MAG: glycosyltransferase family 4 protein [Candidatus Campbellbacteria bacterium]|nr:glycosyltransferase family 4 protein [Candidatus Campbellbacteria bacterium]
MEPRRILIFSLMYLPFVGGAELAVKEITDRINPSEMEFDMITLRADSTLPIVERMGNITIHRIGPSKRGMSHQDLKRFPWYFIKILYPILAARKALSLHKTKPYDAMWSLMTYMGFPAVLARMFGMKVPFILTLQDGDTVEHITSRRRIRFVSPLLKKIFRDTACVQAISNFLADFARAMGHTKKVVVIPNGVTISQYLAVSSDSVERVKGELKKKDDEIFLVTTSRLVEKNGITDVISALPLLPENIRFILCGEGPLLDTLQQQAKDLGVRERIIFLGNMSRELLPSYLHASDIFIRPSLSEGLGSSFLEAMAAGLPVIATPVGGIPDFLFDVEEYGDKATGVFCEVHNPENIAFAVKRLIQDVGMRQRISQNGRALVVEKYDWDIVARSMKDTLESVSLGEVSSYYKKESNKEK